MDRQDAARRDTVDLAEALRLLNAGRAEEAFALAQDGLRIAPRDVTALRLCAAAAASLGRFADAKRALTQAQAVEPETPEIPMMLAKVFYAEGDYARAERAARRVLELRPEDVDAHRALVDAAWLRTGDLDAALAPLDETLRARPDASALLAVRADALRGAGRHVEAWSEVRAALDRRGAGLALALIGSKLALEVGEVETALAVAESAVHAAPDHVLSQEALCHALIAAGRPREALELAQLILRKLPERQDVLAIWSTAARLVGHPNYAKIYDYAAFVRPARIIAPPGWADLPSYLADLQRTLTRIHAEQPQPLAQSLREGSQTAGDLTRSRERVVQAFFSAIQPLIEGYMAAVGRGPDPLRRRNTGAARISGAWSVRLRPGGHHVDHVHPAGWLSSAFYVETPQQALDRPGREGWLQFGRPAARTPRPLPAEHFVRPEPGLLVLFPSYMWHGTVPFTTDERRMTIAFDVVPA